MGQGGVEIQRKRKGERLPHLLYCLLTALVLILCIFSAHIEYFGKRMAGDGKGLRLWVLIALMGWMLLWNVLKEVKLSIRKWNGLAMAISLAMCAFLLWRGLQFFFVITWADAVFVYHSAVLRALGRTPLEYGWYFSIYPNNLFLSAVWSVWMKIFGLFGVGTEEWPVWAVCLQSVMFSLGGYLLYVAAGRRGRGIWAVTAYVLLAGISPWVMLPYSDALGLFWICLLAWQWRRAKALWLLNSPWQGLWMTLWALAAGIGYWIKPTLLCYPLGCMIAALWLVYSKRQWKRSKTWIGAGAWVLGMVLALLAWRGAEKYMGVERDESRTMVAAHYWMMGLNPRTNGVYANEDVEYSLLAANPRERSANALRVGRQRLLDMGWFGTLGFYGKKLLAIYNDGSFAWAGEGGFFPEDMEALRSARNAGSWIYRQLGWWLDSGENSLPFFALQILWLSLLAYGVAASFLALFRPGAKGGEECLALLGLMLFVLLFEARARYLFAFIPVYILLAISRSGSGKWNWKN